MAVGRAEEDLHDQLLGRVARSYFVDGMLQSDIAEAEHLSRPSVSLVAAGKPRALYGNSSRLGYVLPAISNPGFQAYGSWAA